MVDGPINSWTMYTESGRSASSIWEKNMELLGCAHSWVFKDEQGLLRKQTVYVQRLRGMLLYLENKRNLV